jgi:UDP-glucuronate 4-epimerase
VHVLVTGGAGFIGSHLVDSLVADGHDVTVVDNFDPFYERDRKEANIRPHRDSRAFRLVEADIRDAACLEGRLSGGYDCLVHLAARAGVRPSIEDPVGYCDVNVHGTQTLLEYARAHDIRHVVFASSSSVYGVNPDVPWREDAHVLAPISPYASTKISGELLGHVYSRLFGIRFVALRFFTVYGPRQRPDLAIHKFARLMLEGRAVSMYGDGTSRRDYTFVDDVVTGIRGAIAYTDTDFEVFNLGNHRTVSLLEMVRGLEDALGRPADIRWLPAQPGDVPQTWADIGKARARLGFEPATPYEVGVRRFTDWLEQAPALEGTVSVPAAR